MGRVSLDSRVCEHKVTSAIILVKLLVKQDKK